MDLKSINSFEGMQVAAYGLIAILGVVIAAFKYVYSSSERKTTELITFRDKIIEDQRKEIADLKRELYNLIDKSK